MLRRLGTAFLLLGVIATTVAADGAQQRPLGQSRPAFALPDLRGKAQPVTQWDGQILVINFWATWCTPCRREIPLLNALQKEYADRDVQFVGVAVDNAVAVRDFIKSIPIDYPVLIGDMAAVALVEQYGNTSGTLPYTAFIDRNGKIAILAGGALTEEFTRRALRRLLDNDMTSGNVTGALASASNPTILYGLRNEGG